MKKKFFILSDILFLVLLILIICFKNKSMVNADGDILWHIKMGDWFIENRTWYLDKELFSYTMEFKEWIYLSWLGDVSFAFIYKYLGFKGLVLFTDLLIVTSIYMIFRYLSKKGVNTFVLLFVIIFGISLPATHWIVRNHIFGHIFLVIWFIIIERHYEEKDKYLIWILPLINIIWVNMHGGFLYGMTIPAFFAMGAMYDFIMEKDKKRLKKFIEYTVLFISLTITSFINPFGTKFFYKMFFVKSEMFSGFIKGNIGDFSSAQYNNSETLMINLFFLIVTFVLISKMKKIKFHYLCMIIYYTYTSMMYGRNISIYGIMMLFILPQIIELEKIKKIKINDKMKKKILYINNKIIESERKKYVWSFFITIIISLFIIQIPYLKNKIDSDSKIKEYVFPVNAIKFVKKEGITGRCLNNYKYGGYIIWNFYPEKVTFCDTRGSIFELEEYFRYFRILKGVEDFFQAAKDYNIEWVLLNKNTERTLFNILIINEDKIELVYEDSFDAVFKLKKNKE